MHATDTTVLSRREKTMLGLATEGVRGLEIGPLYSPMTDRSTTDVRYVDVHLTDGLRSYYADHPGIPLDEIVEVDYALIHEGRTRSLAEATAADAPFDWVVASHVIEHVPDVIGWLKDVAEILVDGGLLALAIPDRRYCFDAGRTPTTVGQMLLAWHNHDTRPSIRAVFDHYVGVVQVDASQLWRGTATEPPPRYHDLAFAWDRVSRSIDKGEYVDSHVWLFTPVGLVEQLQVLAELDLLDFTVDSVIPTAVDDLEFFVQLRRIPRGLSAEQRRDLLAEGFVPPVETVLPEPEPEPEPELPEGHVNAVVSVRELQALQAKRGVLRRLRGTLSRLRS